MEYACFIHLYWIYLPDYYPPEGSPPPNFTFEVSSVKDGLTVYNVTPGTEYVFQIYHTSETVNNELIWNKFVTVEPNPPLNLTYEVHSGKVVQLAWKPPSVGGYTDFKLVRLPLFEEDDATSKTFYLNEGASPFTLQDLIPGASYEVRIYSLFQGKESIKYTSVNFTTKPNTPGRFVVFFRNETTLMMLWQPPFPSGVFDRYRIAISSDDNKESVLYFDKKPDQIRGAFHDLVPGRGYNISVQTVSRNQLSSPTLGSYHTLPLPPTNVTFHNVTSYSFVVTWSPPSNYSEFDKYQIMLSHKNSVRHTINGDKERKIIFDTNLKPGHKYTVLLKTYSGHVHSQNVTGTIITKPLPVTKVNTSSDEAYMWIKWNAPNNSLQDSYMVKYHELDTFNSDETVQVVKETKVQLLYLLPGRNYSISIMSLSNGVTSDPVTIYEVTKPASPVIESLMPLKYGWNISWKSDVRSRHDEYAVVIVRNDTKQKEERKTFNTWIVLNHLYPGAKYKIKVHAISHGLWSDPHSVIKTVCPKPPENLEIAKVTNSTLLLNWIAPQSLIDYYSVGYYPINSAQVKKIGITNTTNYEIRNLIAGERYNIEVVSALDNIECYDPVILQQTLYPNSINKEYIRTILDSRNVTFQWRVPMGQVDSYSIMYTSSRKPKDQLSRQVPGDISSGKIVTDIINDLVPGELYKFHFYVVSHEVKSPEVIINVRTKPEIHSVIHTVSCEKDSRTLRIKYTPTPTKSVVFDRYRFQLLGTNIEEQEKLFNDTNRLVIFNDLIPGRLYNISIWTISGGVHSIPQHRQARLCPEPVENITAIAVTDTDIILIWKEPFGDKDGYEVQYQDHEGNLVKNVTLKEKISYKNLRPHHNYTFLVTVLSGYNTSTIQRSKPVSETIHTRESVPGKVQYFQSLDVKPNVVTLQWSLSSSDQNGVLTGFKITYYLKDKPEREEHEIFGPNVTQGTIYNLKPGKSYIFEIQAHTKIGPGQISILSLSLPIGAPPLPASNIFPTELSHTSTTIQVRFLKSYFSEKNGPIVAYTLIISEDDNDKFKELELPTWSDVQGFSVWPPYQVTNPYYPFNGTFVEDYVIGVAECKGVKGYCNGPLKPGTSYRVKLRAFTASDKFTDTVYSHRIQTDPDNTPLIVGIVIPLSLLVITFVSLIIWRRRRIVPSMRNGDRHKSDTLSIPESEIITSHPVKLKDFAEHYCIMSADSDFRFAEEFEMLKHVGRDKPCVAADLPVNRPKNRFTNILPYDHSRVKLLPSDDEEGSDYINANYVSGFNSPREFIVTQGPLHSTRDDFWRMVWEQNCRAIVMLTRCVEKGREKCDHYWPFDMQSVYYGDIQVTILTESQYAHWTISEFKICRGEQSRIVRHFHFTTWPDFGVPDPPQTLVKFVRAFRDRVLFDSKPVIVHCSAGVGRSGTFIALDHILQQIQKYDFADIFGIVREMRMERVWMVQNEQQYICIYQCLLCVLDGKEDIIDPIHGEVHENQGYEDDEGIAESGI
ncbi:tyrosine-protein phosphatase 10D-like isoform X2 [Centruroides vittatus]|uniref:tyrosine-protein phosphatase 10D-like isoform X2 n=1 Tax=Centruroides vittatus TaxID=120091 RepID=UPI00351061D0